jgi:hypothetical protein
MYLQEILEVGIGLVFMWLVISIAAMQLQEWIANLLKWRSNDLKAAIRKMLASETFAKEFYNHQLIRALSKDLSWSDRLGQKMGNFFRRLSRKPGRVSEHSPSYIPANDFALTVFDLIMKAGEEASPVRKAFADFHAALDSLGEDKMDLKSKDELKKALGFLLEEARMVATSEVGQASIEAIKAKIRASVTSEALQGDVELLIGNLDDYYRRLLEENANMPAKKDRTVQRLRYGLVALGMNNPKLQESMRTLLIGVEDLATDSEHAVLIARKNIETWFNNSMTRLSGWYKRKAQLVAFLIGLFLAILLNVDSINVATSLWREPTLRQALVENASAFIQENETLPPGEAGQSGAEIVKNLQQELEALTIPFGWETETYILKQGEKCQIIPLSAGAIWGLRSGDACKKISNVPADSTAWLGKFAGILITAMAAAQGAPFWFDILKKLVNVRSSGPNPNEQKPAG